VTNKSDSYINERCVLDIYYPKCKGFATIAWFHGGVSTGGSKEVPGSFQNKGFAIIVAMIISKSKAANAYAAAAIAWAFNNISTMV